MLVKITNFLNKNTELFSVIGTFFQLLVLLAVICFIWYSIAVIKYGTVEAKEVKIGDVTIIYPVANTPSCNTTSETIDLRELKQPGFFGSEHTDYYFAFQTGEIYRVYNDMEVLRWTKDKFYAVTRCNGVVATWEEN